MASQVVLVTGASSGFGRLVAERLAGRGHHVFAGIRDVEGRGQAATSALQARARETGDRIEVVSLDVTSDDSARRAVAAVEARAGTVDVLVNNAGVAAAGLMETFSIDAVHRLFDVNVYGPLRMMRAVLPGMRARGRGLVLQLSSTDGREVMPFLGVYDASKAALEALSEAYRYEVGPLGVEVCLIQPGTFPTTSILQNLIGADDPARAQGYGPVAEGPGALFGAIQGMIAAGQAPDPNLVVDEIVRAVEAAVGRRPTRVVVDPSGFDGAARIDAVCDAVQADLLGRFGLGHLLRPRRAEE